jgi:hypothetical protein
VYLFARMLGEVWGSLMKFQLVAYACMWGHVLYIENKFDLSLTFCPLCLGRIKDKSANDPRLLSVVQGSIIDEVEL